MSQPYVGEIRMFGFSRTPTGWFPCDGRLLSIADYQTLYTLLGTTFGGDGNMTFGVPDLRGRVPLHWGTLPGGSTYVLGQTAGTETVTLTTSQTPTHTHTVIASQLLGNTAAPGTGVIPAAVSGETFYADATGATAIMMSAQSTSSVGNNQPHDNTMPTLTVNICISAFGVFPSQN